MKFPNLWWVSNISFHLFEWIVCYTFHYCNLTNRIFTWNTIFTFECTYNYAIEGLSLIEWLLIKHNISNRNNRWWLSSPFYFSNTMWNFRFWIRYIDESVTSIIYIESYGRYLDEFTYISVQFMDTTLIYPNFILKNGFANFFIKYQSF